MSKTRRYRLGDLQLRILRVLWESGPSDVSEVQQALAGDHAYTTIATMLRKMEDRGLVRHRVEGRKFVYLPSVDAGAVRRGMVEDLLERLFEGSLADMVSHLLSTRKASQDELAALERMIAERRKR